MSNLEHAMKKARLPVTEEGDSIIIDRSVFASHRGGKMCEVSLYETLADGSKGSGQGQGQGQGLSEEARHWKKKYESLKEELDKEEEELESEMEVTAERTEKLHELARLLERKVELMTNPLSDAVKGCNLETQKRILDMYETLTAMTVVETDSVFVCTVKNKERRLVTRFSIQLPEEDDSEVIYTPMANIDLLPENLQSKISCAPSMLPVILREILVNLFEEEEEEDEEEEEQGQGEEA
jgi:hypothetical protein